MRKLSCLVFWPALFAGLWLACPSYRREAPPALRPALQRALGAVGLADARECDGEAGRGHGRAGR